MAETESFEALKRQQNLQNDAFEHDNDAVDEEEEEEEDEDELLINEGGGASLLSESREQNLNECQDDLTGLQVNSGLESHDGVELKQVGVCHNEFSANITSQGAEASTQKLLQLSTCPTSISELSPTSDTQSISSVPSPTLPEKSLSPLKVNTVSVPEAYLQNSSDLKSIAVVHIMKTPVSDGYNWRKYGQKQVKSPKGSRSYYKCTFSDCCAKKIECSDHSGHVVEIVNKGMHSHDPPRKNNCIRESRIAPSVGTVLQDIVSEQPVRRLKDSDPSTTSKDSIQETTTIPDKKRPNLSGDVDRNDEVLVKEEHVHEPEPKKRVKKDNLACSSPVLKPGKKPKFVVHAAGDVGISGDGYRWRKYGQKMVKGNPNPRNYYRCTSAGCPVRKHIETAVDNTNAVIITYKGVHDHDMPVPKKRHGPPSAPLVAAAAPASMNNSQSKKTDMVQNQITSTQWSVGTEGELTGAAMDLGGEKAMESARTLLSIGFEIKPY
ncbi:hypothetical protein Ddye_022023 [Dipteronia dyeriana]|uniref:WRKY domain-containing protein n=1 Tax=Dipteronia dyeriana TaxID=168575 RepID=A0AAD9U3E3_9ROSI|nr:hypothetical protein Ddye_022023 [Dipteronia dyeriana]